MTLITYTFIKSNKCFTENCQINQYISFLSQIVVTQGKEKNKIQNTRVQNIQQITLGDKCLAGTAAPP